MRATLVFVSLFAVFCLTGAHAQVLVTGQAAVHFEKSADTQSPNVVLQGRPSFGWQTEGFLDAELGNTLSFMATVRVAEDQVFNVDYLALRVSDLTPLHLNIQAGKFDVPFGVLGERRYPRKNPLFDLPLMYLYRTALPDHVPTDYEILSGRGQGKGMRLLDGGFYDIGAMVFGSVGILDYSLAVMNGTVSSTSYSAQNSNSDLGMLLRVAVSPITGLTAGIGYAWGGYLADQSNTYGNPATPPQRSINPSEYKQKAAEGDVEFSMGHGMLYGEVVWSSYAVPFETRDQDLSMMGYVVEGKYTLFPRFYIAARFNGLKFGKASFGGNEQMWDYNVDELEAGIGYFLDRNVVVKLVRRETRTYGGTMPRDNLTVMQIAASF